MNQRATDLLMPPRTALTFALAEPGILTKWRCSLVSVLHEGDYAIVYPADPRFFQAFRPGPDRIIAPTTGQFALLANGKPNISQ